MPRVKVMIVDDHTLVREGICSLLSLQEDIEVVAQAADGLGAVQQVAASRPDVVLMDIAMPRLGGLEATLEIKKADPSIKVLVLSQYDDKEYIRRFLKAGASGYILKKAMGAELARAIRAVARGESYLYPSIASHVIEDFLRSEAKQDPDPYELLTDREKQVLKLIGEGMTHKEIASTLGISVKTAIAHQTNISQKLDVRTKTELVKYAIYKGVVKLETDFR